MVILGKHLSANFTVSAHFMWNFALYPALKDAFSFIEDQDLKTVASKFIRVFK